ncbi:hypothetical protein BH09VER1_BH09VER1_21490 [soil metagenome]
MIYTYSLQLVGVVVGLALVGAHLFALLQTTSCQRWLKDFPRSRAVGTVLIAIAGIWSFILIDTMDLGEFSKLRSYMLIAVAAGTFLAWRYVEEFLAVRALGMLALLAADPLLEAAFLRPEESRLLLVVLAYAWIILGLFWVGMPWTLRDQITWLLGSKERFKVAGLGGIIYGAAVLACAAIFWK